MGEFYEVVIRAAYACANRNHADHADTCIYIFWASLVITLSMGIRFCLVELPIF